MVTLAPMASHDQDSCASPHFNCLDLRNVMVQLMLLPIWDSGASGFSDQKDLLPFNCLYLRNTVMPFMMCLVSCDSDTNPSGIMWHQWHHLMLKSVAGVSHDQKSHVTSNFDCLDLRNVMEMLRMLTASCDTNSSANGITWPEKLCCTSFLLFWPKECNDAFGIKWHWHWDQWLYMTRKVILHHTLIIWR